MSMWASLRQKIHDRRRAEKIYRKKLRAFQAALDTDRLRTIVRPEEWERKIEFVAPCYNHGPYLEELVMSVAQQTWRDEPMTLTLVDDNSTDDSWEIMQVLASSFASPSLRIELLRNERNLLQSGALNRGIERSENALFITLNADDVLTSDCLEKIVETYRRESSIFMLGAASFWFSDGDPLPPHEVRPIDELQLTIFTPSDARRFRWTNDLNMSQTSCSFFRPAWEAVGGYWPRERRVCSWDDRDFQMRVCSALPVGVYADYPFMFYRLASSRGRGQL